MGIGSLPSSYAPFVLDKGLRCSSEFLGLLLTSVHSHSFLSAFCGWGGRFKCLHWNDTFVFSPQEQWRHLDSTQKEQYWDLMLETYGKMVSGGEGMGPFDGRR